MRILLVNKFHYRRGGAETYYLELGAALERQGNDVAYFSMKHPQNIPCRWERFFVTQREYNDPRGRLAALRDGAALLYSWEARRLFQALCEEFQPEVVHLNNVHRQITLSILDAPYLRKRQAEVVYTAHDYITVCPSYLLVDGSGELCDRCVADGRYLHCLRRRCVKESRAKSALAAGEAYLNRALRMPEKIDCVIAPSRFMSSMLVKGGWPEGKVRVLRNFADLSQVNRTCMQRDAQDRSRPYFLFAGRLSPEKGLMDLIEAFRIAGGELSGWVGDSGRWALAQRCGARRRDGGAREPHRVRGIPERRDAPSPYRVRGFQRGPLPLERKHALCHLGVAYGRDTGYRCTNRRDSRARGRREDGTAVHLARSLVACRWGNAGCVPSARA